MKQQKNIKILKNIANELSDKLHCDRHGSCVHFAEIFVDEVNEQYPELLNDFDVIEGYVNTKIGDGIPQQHTWIRLENDEIIDPTFLQFTKYDTKSSYSKRKTKVYSGQEYYDEGKGGTWFSKRRKEQPNTVFKESKKEYIRKILREETIKKLNKTSVVRGEYSDALEELIRIYFREDKICDLTVNFVERTYVAIVLYNGESDSFASERLSKYLESYMPVRVFAIISNTNCDEE